LDNSKSEIAVANDVVAPLRNNALSGEKEHKKKSTRTYRHIRYYPRNIKSNDNINAATTKTERVAHMVSWHVRRLKEGWKPSKTALYKAQKYGFRVPPKCTFVDTHIRCSGEVQVVQDEFEVRVTAIDILSESIKTKSF